MGALLRVLTSVRSLQYFEEASLTPQIRVRVVITYLVNGEL